MAKKRVLWVPSNENEIKLKVSDEQKEVVNNFFKPLITKYKAQLQQIDNNKEST